MHKRLAVAIPTYGSSPFLSICLDSIANQTESIECAVCDGGSNFNFEDPKYNWIKYKKLIPDPGMVSCWNEAANSYKTEFIAFLADDNAYTAKFAETMINFMDLYPDCDIAFCNQLFIDEEGNNDIEVSKRYSSIYGRNLLKKGILREIDIIHVINYNSIPLEACIIRRKVWESSGCFREKAAGALDLDLFIRLISKGYKFGFVPEYLSCFRIHENQYSVKFRKRQILGSVWALSNVSTSNKSLKSAIKNKQLHYYGLLLGQEIKNDERMEIYKSLFKSWQGLKIAFLGTLKNIIKFSILKVKNTH